MAASFLLRYARTPTHKMRHPIASKGSEMSSFTAPYRVLILPRWLIAVLNQLRVCCRAKALTEGGERDEREAGREKEKGSGANTSIYLSLYLRGSEGLEGEIGFALPFSDRPTILPQLPGCLPASQPPRSLPPSVWAESASASGQGRYLLGLWAGARMS